MSVGTKRASGTRPVNTHVPDARIANAAQRRALHDLLPLALERRVQRAIRIRRQRADDRFVERNRRDANAVRLQHDRDVVLLQRAEAGRDERRRRRVARDARRDTRRLRLRALTPTARRTRRRAMSGRARRPSARHSRRSFGRSDRPPRRLRQQALDRLGQARCALHRSRR